MSRHDELLDAAKRAVDALHRDMSVSMHRTLEDLCDLRDHVAELIAAVVATMPEDEE